MVSAINWKAVLKKAGWVFLGVILTTIAGFMIPNFMGVLKMAGDVARIDERVNSIDEKITGFNETTAETESQYNKVTLDLARLEADSDNLKTEYKEDIADINGGIDQINGRLQIIERDVSYLTGFIQRYSIGGPDVPIPETFKPPKYKGRIGIIKAEHGTPTASGITYDPNRYYAAKNLNGRLKNAVFGSKYVITNLEYDDTKPATVEIVDTFSSDKDVLLAVSTLAAKKLGFPLKRGMLKVAIHELEEY